ncbi:MAG: DciA family protein [Pseudomonadota bacterium]
MSEGQKIFPKRRSKGFRKTITLVDDRLRKAGESRGFAVTRLLTHWEDVVGPDMADICTPVKVTYAKSAFGATLVVLTTGAQAPMLSMQLDQIRARVNACYGYNAISKVRLTQTAPMGFSDTQAVFHPKQMPVPISPAAQSNAMQATSDIKDPELRAALCDFGTNVIAKSETDRT